MGGRHISAASKVFRLDVRLAEIEPPIRRQIEVPGNVNLSTLHSILQDAMGWEDSHLYVFRVGGADYEEPDPEAEGRNARRMHLDKLGLNVGDAFEYVYDLGDYWRHELRVEAIAPARAGETYPRCLDGARACPPEDCGGVPGYVEALRAPSFDPDAFDLRAANRALRLRSSRPR